MKKYEVIEDNAGGLTLAVFDEAGKVEYLHTGYEYVKGQLTEDLETLKNEDYPVEYWDGNVENPQEAYDYLTSYKHGWKVVADNNGIYPEKMGAAASAEFDTVD